MNSAFPVPFSFSPFRLFFFSASFIKIAIPLESISREKHANQKIMILQNRKLNFLKFISGVEIKKYSKKEKRALH